MRRRFLSSSSRRGGGARRVVRRKRVRRNAGGAGAGPTEEAGMGRFMRSAFGEPSSSSSSASSSSASSRTISGSEEYDRMLEEAFPAEVLDEVRQRGGAALGDDFDRFMAGLAPDERAAMERDLRDGSPRGVPFDPRGEEAEEETEAAAAKEAGGEEEEEEDDLDLSEEDLGLLYREAMEPGSTGRVFSREALDAMREEIGSLSSLISAAGRREAPQYGDLEEPEGVDEMLAALDEKAGEPDDAELEELLDAFEEAARGEGEGGGGAAAAAAAAAADGSREQRRRELVELMRSLGVEGDAPGGPGGGAPELVEYTDEELREIEAEEEAAEALERGGRTDPEALAALSRAGVAPAAAAAPAHAGAPRASEWKADEGYRMATVDRGDDPLPAALSAAVNEAMRDLRYDLKQQESYRARHPHMWHLANRAAPGAAVLRRVLREVRQRLPGFRPASALEAFAKTGSGVWAAAETWPGELRRLVAQEPDARMAELGRRVAAAAEPSPEWTPHGDPRGAGRHPLVLSAYTLEALGGARRREVLNQMWEATTDVLVLVEDGSIGGFAALREARDHLLAKFPPHPRDRHGEPDASAWRADGVTVVAPCAHHEACPLADASLKRSCWFGQRLDRRSLPGRTPAAKLRTGTRVGGDMVVDYFSYLVLQKGARSDKPLPGAPPPPPGRPDLQAHRWPRVVRPVKHVKRQAFLDLCNERGRLERRIVTPSCAASVGASSYREARKASWGDLWRFPPRPRSARSLRRRLGKLLRRAEKRPGLLDHDEAFAAEVATLREQVAALPDDGECEDWEVARK